MIWAGPLNTTSVKSRAERPASQDVSAALKRWGDTELGSNCVRPSPLHTAMQTVVSGDLHRGTCSRHWHGHTFVFCYLCKDLCHECNPNSDFKPQSNQGILIHAVNVALV